TLAQSAPRRLTARRLDLDDVSTQPRQHLRTTRPRLIEGEIEHTDTIQRFRHSLSSERKCAEKGPSASLAPSAAPSTYSKYASGAALRAPPRIWTLLSVLPKLRT